MATGKRASMREGPLADLFRKTTDEEPVPPAPPAASEPQQPELPEVETPVAAERPAPHPSLSADVDSPVDLSRPSAPSPHERLRAARGRVEALDDRNREREGLAGAGGALREDVAAAQALRDHLALDRERRLDATPGIVMPFLAGYTARVQNRIAQATSWDDLVEMVSVGPPLYSPFKALDPVANVGEMFIHHEDVRRAAQSWEPRVLDDSIVAALRRPLALMSRITLAKAPVQVQLQTPAGQRIARAGRGDAVTVTGEPPELLLFVAGRDNAAQVQFDADPETVAAVRAARRSL